MLRSKGSSLLAVLAPVVALAACKSGGEVTCINPADPACVNVATVTVSVQTSPEDTVVQVGSSAQLLADIEDTNGAAVTALAPAWTSSTTATATIGGGNGLMLAVAPGTTTIQAMADGVSGQQTMVVVNAPLPLITTIVTDTLAGTIRQLLTNTPRAAIATGLTACAARRTAGNIVGLDNCLDSLTTISGGTNENDNVLLSVLDRFFDAARAQLPL